MVALLITGHGHFASGLFSSLRLITGITEHIEAVDFEADHSIETLSQNLSAARDRLLTECKSVLVLSDLAGGSPFKTAVECSAAMQDRVCVVAGSNLAMLIEGAMQMDDFDEARALADELMQIGRDAIVCFGAENIRQQQDTEEDGI